MHESVSKSFSETFSTLWKDKITLYIAYNLGWGIFLIVQLSESFFLKAKIQK